MDTKPILDDVDEKTNVKIVDHIIIRDTKSGVVLVNQRGSVVSPLIAEKPRNEDDGKAID